MATQTRMTTPALREAAALVKARRYEDALGELRACPPDGRRDQLLQQVCAGLARLALSGGGSGAARLLRDAAEATGDQALVSCLLAAGIAGDCGKDAGVSLAFYFGRLLSVPSPGCQVLSAIEHQKRDLQSRLMPTLAGQDFWIQFLKDFSSYTPLLASPNPGHLGGGYLAALGGYGLVIDPGHHFLDNFYGHGRTIADIDAIAVTHFHDDHYADLPALLSLLHRRHREDRRSKVDLFLDPKTSRMFGPIIRRSAYVRELRRLSLAAPETTPLGPSASITPLVAHHGVLGRDSAVGLRIDVPERGARLVITGDTRWREDMASHYRACRAGSASLPDPPGRVDGTALIAHVSTACVEEALGLLPGGVPTYHGGHLAVRGLCRAIEEVQPSWVILSEIGEELEDAVDALASLVHQAYGVQCRVARNGKILYLCGRGEFDWG